MIACMSATTPTKEADTRTEWVFLKITLHTIVLTPSRPLVPARDDVGAVASAALQSSNSCTLSSLFALRALLNALSPLVHAEAELGNRAVSAGWAKEATKDDIDEWSSKGVALVKKELEDTFRREYEAEYNARMRQARLCCGSYVLISQTPPLLAPWSSTRRGAGRRGSGTVPVADARGTEARFPPYLPATDALPTGADVVFG